MPFTPNRGWRIQLCCTIFSFLWTVVSVEENQVEINWRIGWSWQVVVSNEYFLDFNWELSMLCSWFSHCFLYSISSWSCIFHVALFRLLLSFSALGSFKMPLAVVTHIYNKNLHLNHTMSCCQFYDLFFF